MCSHWLSSKSLGYAVGLSFLTSLSACGPKTDQAISQRKQVESSTNGTISSSKSPIAAAISMDFKDENDNAGFLNGVLTIGRASDEKSLTDYVVYWGTSASTKLIIDGVPLATLSKSLPELSFTIPNGTYKPFGATHLLVFTKNSFGEMEEGVSVLIKDKGLPAFAAGGLYFTDENLAAKLLTGPLLILKAFSDSDITHYVLYWGSDNSTKLSAEPISTIDKANLSYNFMATPIPVGATHLLLFSKNSDGEGTSYVSTLIIDKGVPVNAAVSIGFTDTEIIGRALAGNIEISKASNESDLSDYVIYWGSSASTKLLAAPIATLPKTGANLTYAFPAPTSIPTGASHFLVFTRNNDGEMAVPVSVLIIDKGVPVNAAVDITFTDTDLDGGQLAGSVNITKALNETDVSAYNLYWGSNTATKLGFIVSILKTGANLTYSMPMNTPKPANATHLLVFTRNTDGEMATGKNVAILDKGVPGSSPSAIAFTDVDLVGKKLSGPVTISKASNESDVVDYVLYWGSSSAAKLLPTPIAVLPKTAVNLVYTLPLGTALQAGATHFLVFTRNLNGENAVPANTLIVDRGVPANAAASIAFTDADLDGGQLAGTVNISKALNEADLTHYNLYWGSNSTTKLNSTAIVSIPKNGANLIYSMPSNTVKPATATHILVFTRSNIDEMATGKSVAILDKAVPTIKASALAFVDQNLNEMELGGPVKISKASSELDIKDYALYWGFSSTSKLLTTPISVLAKTGSDLVYNLPEGTSIPSGATHFLVFTRNSDGEMATGVSRPIIDALAPPTAIPEFGPSSIDFFDTDPANGKVGGNIFIGRAFNENSITSYILYWVGFDSKRIGLPIATLPKTGRSLIYSLPSGSPIPLGAWNIVAVTKNQIGESPLSVMTLFSGNIDRTTSSQRSCALDPGQIESYLGNGLGCSGTVVGSLTDPSLLSGTSVVKASYFCTLYASAAFPGASCCAIDHEENGIARIYFTNGSPVGTGFIAVPNVFERSAGSCF